MLRTLLIILITPALSFAQKGKLYLSVDGSYGTNKIASADVSAGYTNRGFHIGIGGGIQENPSIDYKQFKMTLFPMFAEIGFMKTKLPFLTIRGGGATIHNSSRRLHWYTNGRIGMPIQVAKNLYVSPFLYASAWKLEVNPSVTYAYVPLRSRGFGLMVSRF